MRRRFVRIVVAWRAHSLGHVSALTLTFGGACLLGYAIREDAPLLLAGALPVAVGFAVGLVEGDSPDKQALRHHFHGLIARLSLHAFLLALGIYLFDGLGKDFEALALLLVPAVASVAAGLAWLRSRRPQ